MNLQVEEHWRTQDSLRGMDFAAGGPNNETVIV